MTITPEAKVQLIREIISEEIERAIGKRIASVDELRAAAAKGQHVAYNVRYRAPADAVIANKSADELAALIEDGVTIITPATKEQN